ncbi:MAG: flavodoxin family protein [Desulfovibrio sp.]|uniref:flavodoxin family protein n=1 Tax=Desulfovibrio sp. 7SRBS1 TaxID=3378064 RepID=UPI003B3EC026
MKVIMVNGSPHPKGCTYTALSTVAEPLNRHGVETEIFNIGTKALSGCIACRKCAELGKCVFEDKVNEFVELASTGDGFIFGSPVHCGGVAGTMTSFMNRLFFSLRMSGKQLFQFKPGAVVVSTRRSGASGALDQFNKYLNAVQMPVVSSCSWNIVHGNTPDEVRQDLEGMQTMRVLGNNMAWLLKCLEAGRKSGISLPEQEERVSTNFIR